MLDDGNFYCFLDAHFFEQETTEETKQKAVWQDEDDAKIMVNIGRNKRARKLRTDDDETTITGAEYTRRLQVCVCVRVGACVHATKLFYSQCVTNSHFVTSTCA